MFLFFVLFFQGSEAARGLWGGSLAVSVAKLSVFRMDKIFADMPLRPHVNASAVEDEFAHLTSSWENASSPLSLAERREAVRAFVTERFSPGSLDTVSVRPRDWLPSAPFLHNVRDSFLRRFGEELHYLWLEVAQQDSEAVAVTPALFTLLPLPRPYVIPGGRLRELHSWDSYFIVRGLLVSGMAATAADIVDNLIHLAVRHGFVPLGARAYYLNRAGPPMLSSMVSDIYAVSRDLDLVARAIPAILAEHAWWQRDGRAVQIASHSLNRYTVATNASVGAGGAANISGPGQGPGWDFAPRPEHLGEDLEFLAAAAPGEQRDRVFASLAAASMSGWELSSRWGLSARDPLSLRASEVIPVDLNCMLHLTETHLAAFLALVGGREAEAKAFEARAEAREAAIDAVFWNDALSQWTDYDLAKGAATSGVFASNFFPLWSRSYGGNKGKARKALEAVKVSGLLLPGGVTCGTEPPPPPAQAETLLSRFASASGLSGGASWVQSLLGLSLSSSTLSPSVSSPSNFSAPSASSFSSPSPFSSMRSSLHSSLPFSETLFVSTSSRIGGVGSDPGNATTTTAGGLWDWPNVWAPEQLFLAEGLARTGIPEAEAEAEDIANKWLQNAFLSYVSLGRMREAYRTMKIEEKIEN